MTLSQLTVGIFGARVATAGARFGMSLVGLVSCVHDAPEFPSLSTACSVFVINKRGSHFATVGA